MTRRRASALRAGDVIARPPRAVRVPSAEGYLAKLPGVPSTNSRPDRGDIEAFLAAVSRRDARRAER